MATQRKPTTANTTAPKPSIDGGGAADDIKAIRQPSQSSPFFPTKLETALLLIYPVTLVLGSIFSVVAPHITRQSASYNSVHQSYYPPSAAPSYFAQKRNIFNVYFVKKGWFWTTVAFFLFVFTHPSLGAPLRPSISRRRLQAILRWVVATTIWIFVTQWFFGPAIIDRGFRWTGGVCEVLADSGTRAEMSKTTEYFTAKACKVAGGKWTGGHDISGHVFLLILGSALLWMEVLPTILKAQGLHEERRVKVRNGRVVKTRSIVDGTVGDEGYVPSNQTEEQYTKLGVKVIVGIVALMWWMLLMTAAFFHTWFEKFTGFVVAFLGIGLIYFLPRGVPALRAILGMPGL
ncbi:uncharacterized protein PV09_02932 [Verruconis gallopava]|uniref:Acyl-coenzyme A diphosphatase SCS3 n=1 Tax=Verruconis gallopava TaxID=253628 RepID=A0A0D1Z0L4_9PEZI|nr:uncharacterized protein PV09_02932 [Verruconis gallopava]KIW06497.1 hypothetical protein PV09_02932 [Verruconis gallopava]